MAAAGFILRARLDDAPRDEYPWTVHGGFTFTGCSHTNVLQHALATGFWAVVRRIDDDTLWLTPRDADAAGFGVAIDGDGVCVAQNTPLAAQVFNAVQDLQRTFPDLRASLVMCQRPCCMPHCNDTRLALFRP